MLHNYIIWIQIITGEIFQISYIRMKREPVRKFFLFLNFFLTTGIRPNMLPAFSENNCVSCSAKNSLFSKHSRKPSFLMLFKNEMAQRLLYCQAYEHDNSTYQPNGISDSGLSLRSIIFRKEGKRSCKN